MNTARAQQKWGQGKIQAANKRRRIATSEPSNEWDGDFGDANHFDDDMEEENLFDSCERLLNQRELEAEKLNANKEEEEPAEHREQPLCDETAFSRQYNDDQFSCNVSYIGGEGSSPQRKEIISSMHMTNNNYEEQRFNATILDPKERTGLQTATKRTKQYSFIKSSTPRFTFQSTVKKAAFQTPSHRQSLPQRNLFSSQTSAKRIERHSFRKSMGDKPSTSATRKSDCTPSFLPGRHRKDGISQESPEINEGPSTTSFASLRKSNLISDKPPPNTQRNGKSGYLIQRLRSLRSNEQMKAMRLRSGQFSSGALARKRRRSGNEYSNIKHSAKTELDVTVAMMPGGEGVFGEGRSVVVGYIHRFECSSVSASSELKCPCFSWIILSNEVLREQGVTDGSAKQLRFYDAVVIPKRMHVVSQSSELIEAAMPTVVCTSVYEKYSAETTLPDVSFDQFFKSA